MKITRRQLKNLIKESLSENTSNENINITMDVPGREGVTFSVKAIGNKVTAILESDEGNRQIGDNEEDKQILLGILRATLETTPKEDTKLHLVKLIARLTGESESQEDMPALMSKILNDRNLSSYAKHIQDKKTRLV
jgi:hypothetical protein